MTQRVMIYVICRLVEMGNAGTGPLLDDWWVDCTEEGSSKIEAIKTARNAAAVVSGIFSKTSVTQYHVYYQDGGHARFKERYYVAEEQALWPTVPTLEPGLLVPTPEYIPG